MRHTFQFCLVAAAALAVGAGTAFAAPGSGGTTVDHYTIHETFVDEDTSFFCGFTVVLTVDATLTDLFHSSGGAQTREHTLFMGPRRMMFLNPANGLSVELLNALNWKGRFVENGETIRTVFQQTGVNYRIWTPDGVIVSAGSFASGIEFTFADDGTPTSVDVFGHSFTPNFFHAYPILCALLGAVDSDHDYLPDTQGVRTEGFFGTDPLDPDTDDDGKLDGWEVANETDPTNPAHDPQPVGDLDKDNDFLRDGAELLGFGTDPLNPDTDGDGFLDGLEVRIYDTDPLDPGSHP